MYWLLRPDSVTAFEEDGVVKALGRYVEVSSNRKPANFMICKSIGIGDAALDAPLETLWKLHDEKIEEFMEAKREIDDKDGMRELKVREPSLLDLKLVIANEILKSCHLCERKCGTNRAEKKLGFCNLDKTSRLSTEFLHMGEEACLVPSHTFFFIGCTLYCVFCQNWTISRQRETGRPITGKELAELAKKRRILEKSKNINLVGGEPTPNLHTILDMLMHLDENVPVVWNSNMYMSNETMKLLNGVVDVYLTDFKYGSNDCANRLSKVKNYWDIITRNHLLAREHAELLIRHLVLPNHVECCSKPILAWIAENLDNEVRVNIMGQYHPEFQAFKFGDISRAVDREEVVEAIDFAREKGLWNLN